MILSHPRFAILLISFFLNFGLALFILVTSRRTPSTLSFSFTVLAVAFWSLAQGIYEGTTSLAAAERAIRFAYLSAAFIASNFYTFSLHFPRRVRPVPRYIQGLILSFPITLGLLLPGGFLIASVDLTPLGKGIHYRMADYFFFSVGFIALMGAAFINLLRRYRRLEGKEKMQVRYVLLGTSLATAFGVYFNLLLPAFGRTELMWLGPPFTVLLVGFVSYAIIRHRLMDIRILLSRTIVYSVLLVTSMTFYTMVILASQRFFVGGIGSTASLLVGSFLVAVGFEPLRRFFQRITDRFFFRKGFDPQQLLAELSLIFNAITDLDRLLSSVTERLAKAFATTKAAVIVVEEENGTILAGGPIGLAQAEIASLTSRPQPLLEYYDRHVAEGYFKTPPKHEAVRYELMEAAEGGSEKTLAEGMVRLGLELVVPIFRKDKFIGILILGPKRSGEAFFPDELALLNIIAGQAATAIENAALYKAVQRQMDELKKVQIQQLMQSAKLASIGELAMSVAHEINNPLTGILGFTNLILKGLDATHPHYQDLKIIESEALRSRAIVRNLLDFARPSEPRKEEVEINEVARNTLLLVRYQAQTSNLEIVEQYASALPRVLIDVDQIKQVFINIIKNAFDAMPNGGRLIIRTFLPTEQTGATLVGISFQDTGAGIPLQYLPKIFDPFFTTKGELMGTGLGLAVSYSIIEKHGGRLEAESEPGRGATFTVKVPVAPAAVGKGQSAWRGR